MMKAFNIGYRVGHQDGQYGEYRATRDGNIFVPWGRDVKILKIMRSLEKGEFALTLGFDLPQGGKEEAVFLRSEIAENSLATKLSAKGASVSSKRIDVLQSYLNEQFETFSEPVSSFHDHVGWWTVGETPIFRAYTAIGSVESLYHGNLDILPHGSYKNWKKMIQADVLCSPLLTVILLAALSSVLVGFLHHEVVLLNPIFSVSGVSSSGKSTAGILAASTALRPTMGVRKVKDSFGGIKDAFGGITTWDSTKNALLSRLSGNCGMVAVLDELSKTEIKDLSAVVYALSEGMDKDRLTKECVRRAQPDFHTSIISIGEEKLLDRCRKNQEGLPMRVMEITGQLTNNADHANRIVTVCRNNYGFASSKMAEYIIHIGMDSVLDVYHKCVYAYRKKLSHSPFADRRAQNFGGLLVATAKIAKAALGIPFDIKLIQKTLINLDKTFLATPDTATKAYTDFLEWVQIQRHKFSIDDVLPHGECYGKIYAGENLPRRRSAPENLFREIAIFPQVFARFLESHGYTNKAQLLKTWRSKGLIITDQGKTTYRRKIGGSARDVIIVREFQSSETQCEETEPSYIINQARVKAKQQEVLAMVERDLTETEMEGEL